MSAVCLSRSPEPASFGAEHTVSYASVAMHLSCSWQTCRLSDTEHAPSHQPLPV